MRHWQRLLLSAALIFLGWAAEGTAQPAEHRESEETIRARYEYWLARRADAGGNYSMDDLLRAKAELDARRTIKGAFSPQDAAITNWEWLGPGNVGGRVQDIVINPSSHNLMWIASPGGGIWKTTNGGGSWSPVNDFLPMLNVVSLAMCPMNFQIMYAGTGEREYMGFTTNGRVISGTGIYKSTDGGNTWFRLENTHNDNFNYVTSLAPQPGSYTHLLAATSTGVMQTTDAGDNWTRLMVPDFANEYPHQVKYDPANPAKILVGTTTDLYISSNSGSDWTRLTTGPLGDTTKLPFRPGRCAAAIAPTNTNVIYVSISDYNGGSVYKSTNGGASWHLRNLNTTALSYANAIWVSPTDPNLVVVGGSGNFQRSTDGGTLWSEISRWDCYQNGRDPGSCTGFSPHGDVHAIVADPSYNGTWNRSVYFCDDGGVQVTSDILSAAPFATWINLANNLGITQFYGGAASPDGRFIVGGTQDLYNVNYYKYTQKWGWPYSGPQGWWNFIFGDGGYAAIDYQNPQYMYVEAQWLGVDRSIDSGQSYQAMRDGLTDAGKDKSLFVAPLVMDPNNPQVLIAGGRSIWRTANRAAHWDSIRPHLAGTPMCSAIDISSLSSGTIWVGYDNGVVSYTTNSGGSWTNANQPWGTRFVTDLAIDPASPGEVIVTLGGNTTDNIRLTTDNGVTWTIRTGTAPDNLPALQVNTVRYHPLQTNWIYVGTDLGVFASEDKGQHWNMTPLYADNEGPVNTPVEELFWQGTSYLIAATHGRGMFRCKPLPVVYVDYSYSAPDEDGSQFKPYNTVAEAVASYGPGALISIKGGTYDEPAIILNKRGRVRATNGTVIIH